MASPVNRHGANIVSVHFRSYTAYLDSGDAKKRVGWKHSRHI